MVSTVSVAQAWQDAALKIHVFGDCCQLCLKPLIGSAEISLPLYWTQHTKGFLCSRKIPPTKMLADRSVMSHGDLRLEDTLVVSDRRRTSCTTPLRS